jgi:formiminotetrahydrofolate cyclodeaminase
MSEEATGGTAERAIASWLVALGSDEPTPGGGAFAAVSAAAGASLIAMVARLTQGREALEDQDERMREIVRRADEARAAFVRMADRDAAAFEAVLRAYRMPKDRDDQREARTRTIQSAYLGAAEVPMEVAERAVALMPLAREATAHGSANAASDGYSGAVALSGAVLCAAANVRINAAGLKDDATRQDLLDRIEGLRQTAADHLRETETAFGVRLQG